MQKIHRDDKKQLLDEYDSHLIQLKWLIQLKTIEFAATFDNSSMGFVWCEALHRCRLIRITSLN